MNWKLVLLILLSFVIALLTIALLAAADAPVHQIEIVAKRFAFVPDEITLKKGEPVTLVFHSEDVTHGIKFKELNLQTEILKEKSSELSFTPAATGTFEGKCSRFCGVGHGSMKLTLKVTD